MERIVDIRNKKGIVGIRELNNEIHNFWCYNCRPIVYMANSTIDDLVKTKEKVIHIDDKRDGIGILYGKWEISIFIDNELEYGFVSMNTISHKITDLMKTIVPCKCGETATLIQHRQLFNNEPFEYEVICCSESYICGKHTKLYKTPEEAIIRWNKRMKNIKGEK